MTFLRLRVRGARAVIGRRSRRTKSPTPTIQNRWPSVTEGGNSSAYASRRPMTEPSSLNVLGVRVDAIDMSAALRFFDEAIGANDRTYVCVTGVHGVMESQRDPHLRAIHNRAGLVTPDGMPLVWLGKLQGASRMDRVYGPDLLLEVCARSVEQGYRHFFFGGAEGVAEQLAQRLQGRFPGLQVVGHYTPPFRQLTQEEEADLERVVAAAKPDIMWVGLSTPKQERFMSRMVGRLEVPVMVGVGAAFDFHAGRKRQAPRWMQRSGLEWFFRMVTEPRRLAGRYMRNNPLFVALVTAQLLGLRRYRLEPKIVEETI